MGKGPHVLDCDALIGEAVLDARGQNLGVLAHLMLDAGEGRIAYAVVGRGGVLGIGEKLHAIPWSAITIDAQRQCVVLDVDGETLDAAPVLDRTHWPGTADPAWQAVDRYYGKRT
jgi:sporulation protein YlmC with PRC-barrel domain